MSRVQPIVLVSDPAVAAMEARECGEPLVRVVESPRLRVDQRLADSGGLFRLVRSGLSQRLTAASELIPEGMALALVEGYRPPSLQARYFEAYRSSLAASGGELDTAKLYHLAARAVAPPGPAAPHVSGGAVDVTLYGADGTELDMGSALNATPEESRGACYTEAAGLTKSARHNRGLLVEALSRAGFVNYPTEWWHWSYGDRYWALRTGAKFACYGPADPPRTS